MKAFCTGESRRKEGWFPDNGASNWHTRSRPAYHPCK
jgi:hypothetical protein